MVEQVRPAGDANPSVNASALNVEHERTLQALQSEINYHRERDEKDSYMDKAIKLVIDSSSDTLHNLEIAYDAEKDKPNSVKRDAVIAAVKEDQLRIKDQDTAEWVASGLTSFVLFAAGGRKWGQVLGAASMSASSMHPSDSIGKQALQGLLGVGESVIAGRAYNRGMNMRNPIGAPLGLVSYPLIGAHARSFTSDRQAGDPPDPEKIYGEPVQMQAPGTATDNGVSAPSTTNWRPPYNGVAPSAAEPRDGSVTPRAVAPSDGAVAPPTTVPRAPSDWYK